MDKKCFDFKGYKAFIRHWVEAQPGRGRGLYRKISAHLRIHSTMMSHIVGGPQHLTEDQALALADFIGLNELETEYLIELVRFDRAATLKLKERIQARLTQLKDQSQDVKNRVTSHHQLSPEQSARFYSNWFYSALRLLADIPEYQTRAKLLDALPIPRQTANDAIEFLLATGLCREEGGRIKLGPSRTHLPATSPYIWTLHKNWRMKAIERHVRAAPNELFYSAPMSISRKDAAQIRELLLQSIARVTEIAGASQDQAETLVGLNIDWYSVI